MGQIKISNYTYSLILRLIEEINSEGIMGEWMHYM